MRIKVRPILTLLLICLIGTTCSIWMSSRLTLNCATLPAKHHPDPSSPLPSTLWKRSPKGVFIIKAARVEDAMKTLCSLTHFFNAKHQYPVRIFVDHPDTTNATGVVLNDEFSGGADLQVVEDTDQQWKKLPDSLTLEERTEVLKYCKNLDAAENATCTTSDISISLLHRYLWQYNIMPFEPSLQQYDYFISINADTLLTQPMQDPFRLMQDYELIGIFDTESYQAGDVTRGIQETAEAMFTLDQRRGLYLNSPEMQIFDNNGVWNSVEGGGQKPSVWTYFYGGRIDFFQSETYKEFARRMIPYLYTYRVDDQSVIGAAWALMADNSRVWYLPKRGIELGIYHHGWIDNREAVRVSETDTRFQFHSLDHWLGFEEHYGMLLGWEDYVKQIGYGGWGMCASVQPMKSIVTRAYPGPRTQSADKVLAEKSEEIRQRLTPESRSFVLSLKTNQANASEFVLRNKDSVLPPVSVVPGVDGWIQKTMDVWGDLLGQHPRNVSDYNSNSVYDKDRYDSPHAVGCYLAHWNLWRTLVTWQSDPLPQAYFIFEDDATCAPDMHSIAAATIRHLPEDWDLLFIGGKPFTFFREGPLRKFNDSTEGTFRRDICRGGFGKGDGPLAPDGSRNLSLSQPYWRAMYHTNTHGYVINPRQLNRLLHLMKPAVDNPIDIRLADKMATGELRAYMTTRMLCQTDQFDPADGPGPWDWQGMFAVFLDGVNENDAEAHPILSSAIGGRYIWDLQLMLENCSY